MELQIYVQFINVKLKLSVLTAKNGYVQTVHCLVIINLMTSEWNKMS